MSTVFSRRSFLKYTAVAAVAVAGTSLLGGCSGSGAETAIQTTYPSDNVVLKVKSTLESLEYDPTSGNATFTIHIVNGRKNPIVVSPNRFAVKAYDKNNNCIANIFVGSTQGSLNAALVPGYTNPISRGKECICTVIASGLPVMKAEDTECPIASLRIIYTPDTEYNEYTANWIISPDTAVPALGWPLHHILLINGGTYHVLHFFPA